MVLKRMSMYGLEIELLTLDNEGKLINGAPKVLEEAKGDLEKYVRKEISKSMVELGAKEKRTVHECAAAFLEKVADVLEIAEKLDYHLLPLGCHPGSVNPELSKNSWYDAKKAVLGEDTYKEGRICGFHFHYTLPEGIIEKERIKDVKRSEAREIFLHQYNFLTAADPAILTFCQSTPFWMGMHWAKDCRVMIYRDMKITKGDKTINGIHYYLPLFGSIPNYEFTLRDLRVMADTRKTEWLRMLEQKGFPTNEIACYPTLKFMWGPLRVNKIGTFEYRGPDMNHPEIIFSVSQLLVDLLEAIEKMDIKALPSDVGIEEPFVLEDNTLYLPPHSTLKYLEHQSVTRGFEPDSIQQYCGNLLKLADQLGIEPDKRVQKMFDEKKTTSDGILDMVKKNKFDIDSEVPGDMLDHVALFHADRMASGIDDLIGKYS